MAILQALIALIGRSAGKILNAIFGWAVRALFGPTAGSEQTVLTVLVASAALWPLLLIGVVAPRVAAFALAFVPIPKSFPEWPIRMLWITLALVVPGIVGLALAYKAPPGTQHESFLTRVARGYPTTLGIAIAFLMSFVSVPLRRIASIARGREDKVVPLLIPGPQYEPVSRSILELLNARDFKLQAAEPGFWMRAPMDVMRRLGGAALRNYVPEHLNFFRGPQLEVMVYPNSLLLRGAPAVTLRASGLCVEALTPCAALQTTDGAAQQLEHQIKRVWSVWRENPAAHTDSPRLSSRLQEIARDLAELSTSADDWQILYRQTLQLGRALRGEPQLLAQTQQANEANMEHADTEHRNAPVHNPPVQELSITDLMREIASKATVLVSKEVELARAELKNDLHKELAMVKALAVAAVTALLGLNLLCVAAVFGLAHYMPEWMAALALGGVLLAIAVITGLVGWGRHVSKPMALTRSTLKEDVQWAKEEMA